MVSDRPMCGTSLYSPSTSVGFAWMLQTPRMPTCGGLSTGVKLSMPKAPRLVTVKVPPLSSSGVILPSRQAAASRFASVESWRSVSELASRTTGTIKPLAVSTATPKCTLRYW